MVSTSAHDRLDIPVPVTSSRLWTLEAAADPRRITRDPDPKSHWGDIRVIGYSPAAGFVITVIVDHVDHSGINAWKTSGADLRAYRAALGREDDAS